MLSLETPPAAPPPGGATFGAGAEAQHQILELSTLENGHFQPPKGAVGVSLKRLRRTTSGCPTYSVAPVDAPASSSLLMLLWVHRRTSQLEVSGFCNQYKYALPTSDQDVRQEARGRPLPLVNLPLSWWRSSPCSVLCRPEFVVLCKPQKRHFDAANVLFRQGILQSLPQARVSS